MSEASDLFASPEQRAEVEAKLERLGVTLIEIPPPSEDDALRLEGWRTNRLRDWLEEFGVPDNTDGSGQFPIWHDL